jgi:tetratricopeptide (TPR) repeat protein
MPVQVSKIEISGGVSGIPGTRPTILSPLISTFRSRWRVNAIVVVMLLATMGGCQNHAYSDHWQQALKAIEDRDFSLAQTQLNRCLEISPLNAEAHFLMGRVCRRADDFAGWQDHLQNAAILGWPQDQIYLEVRLKEAQVDNTWKVEEELKTFLTSGHPEEALIVEALVRGYLENDRPMDAYRLAEEWIKNSPNDWLARLYHGRACQRGVRFEEAIADYEKVLELNPNQAEAHLWLANTFASNTQFDRAMEHYRTYLEVHPDDADALFGLAKCQFTQGDSESARTKLDELLGKYPNHNAGLYLRAQLEQAESHEKALPWLRRALAFAPNQTDILHNLILALRALHRDAEADQYEKRLKDCRNKETQLIELIAKVVKEPDKDNLALRYQAAVLYLELGHEDEAAHWFQTILYVDGNHQPTLRALADYWEKHGDARRAAYYRERAEGKTASRNR